MVILPCTSTQLNREFILIYLAEYQKKRTFFMTILKNFLYKSKAYFLKI
jgi:hypothetical protein